jgi:hypothetical protein
MQDLAIQFLKDINIGQLLAIGFMFWYFYSRLDVKIKESKNELGSRIDKLSDKVEDVDRRLCRIEGRLATQGHCLFNQSACEKKAE